MNYKLAYHMMVDAAEKAIEAIDDGDAQKAKELLVAAEQMMEEAYLRTEEDRGS